MVALSQMLPTDPDERERVRRVLREHPGLEAFIERVSRHAAEVFPGAEMMLDTRQYDDWDPPIRLSVTAPYTDREAFSRLDREWTSWLLAQPGYDPSRIFVTVLPHNLHRRIA
ncbi:MAG TPA: hypothetical protein VM450_00755 [Thermomicrobiales bacterium]|nr:hypothetical protein [Thermomicrobiales bacterium]